MTEPYSTRSDFACDRLREMVLTGVYPAPLRDGIEAAP